MNKETYEHACVEIISFHSEDVIITSESKPEYEESIIG